MEEIFTEIEDISDPSLMDHIHARLEEIQAEDDEFMEILLSRRNEMIVTWHQPLYQTYNCLTRPIAHKNMDEIEMFRTDTICSDEHKMIHKNWKKFKKMFNVPNKPICLARWRNKEKCKNPSAPEEFVRRFVISFLAQGLERNLYQVYKHVVSYYGSPNRGKYSKYEENVMKVCFEHCRKNAVPYLSAVLSRDPRGIQKRLTQMEKGTPERKKLKWTLPLATKFLKLLLNLTGETEVENLKQQRFDTSIWSLLENVIDQRSRNLQQFWYDSLHVQLFIKADVKINKLRKKILKILRLYPYKVWSDIRWKEVAKHFPDGFTPTFLYRILHGLICRNIDRARSRPLEEVIDEGIKKIKSTRNRRLKTLHFNDNQELEIIKYSNKLQF